MTASRDRMRNAIVGGNAALNASYDDLAVAVRGIVESHAVMAGGKKILLPSSRGRIMRKVDQALNALYPTRPGVTSALEEAIVARCAATEQAEATAAWNEIAKAAPDVARVVEASWEQDREK